MVMVNPSYSFPGSLKLGTLELTVKPSLVLLLNCFRKYKHTETEGATWGFHCFMETHCHSDFTVKKSLTMKSTLTPIRHC